MATPKKRSRQEIMDELMAAIAQEKKEHDARISRVGIFIFPHAPDLLGPPEKDTDPHVVLAEIDRLLRGKQHVEALDKLLEIGQKKREELAAKVTKKTPPKTHLKNVAAEARHAQ